MALCVFCRFTNDANSLKRTIDIHSSAAMFTVDFLFDFLCDRISRWLLWLQLTLRGWNDSWKLNVWQVFFPLGEKQRSFMEKNVLAHTHTHTQPFNDPLSGTTQVSRYHKAKTSLDFTEATDSEWQWHQLGHMQICTSLQTDNHASTPPLSFYRPDALPAAQQTASKHWSHKKCPAKSRFSGKTSFYRAMLCIRGTSHGPMSVCLSQVGVLLKRQNVGSHKQHHTIPQGL